MFRDATFIFRETVGLSRGQKKPIFVNRETIASYCVALVFNLYFEIFQTKGIFCNFDYLKNLLRLNSVIVVICTPKLKSDDFLCADSASAVDVKLTRFADFSYMEMRRYVFTTGYDEGDFIALLQRIFELLKLLNLFILLALE